MVSRSSLLVDHHAHMLHHMPTSLCCYALQTWAIGAFVAFLVIFNVLPALLELLTFVFVAKVNFVRY